MSNQQRIVLLALAAAVLTHMSATSAKDRPPQGRVVFVDQSWSQEDRLSYYFTSQGSAALSYNMFLQLDPAKSQEFFRADENTARYGLVPHLADPSTTRTDCPWA